jgi:hypothetical protein
MLNICILISLTDEHYRPDHSTLTMPRLTIAVSETDDSETTCSISDAGCYPGLPILYCMGIFQPAWAAEACPIPISNPSLSWKLRPREHLSKLQSASHSSLFILSCSIVLCYSVLLAGVINRNTGFEVVIVGVGKRLARIQKPKRQIQTVTPSTSCRKRAERAVDLLFFI